MLFIMTVQPIAKPRETKSPTERLAAKFPEPDSNQLRAIKDMFSNGRIYTEKAEPWFFDALIFVMQHDWSVCDKVCVIYLTLVRDPKDYSANVYPVHTVLNELILRSNLQSLTLRRFGSSLLVACLATLPRMEQLDYLDVSSNELTFVEFDFVLRLLPDDPIDKITVDFFDNQISGGGCALLLNACRHKLGTVKLKAQTPNNLDIRIVGDLTPQITMSFDDHSEK